MKIAMIGASGFVGTRLLDLLRQEPKQYECKNIDLLPSHFFNEIPLLVMCVNRNRWTEN